MDSAEKDDKAPAYAEQVPSMRKMIKVIREDNPQEEWWIDSVTKILEAVTEQPGTTVQDALQMLDEVKKILLQYQCVS